MEEPKQLVEEPSVEVPIITQQKTQEIITEGVTPIHDKGGGYVEYNNALFQKDALKELRPDLFALKVDGTNELSTSFGTSFPKIAGKGDIFVRVDVMPNRVFKFDGKKWLEVQKNQTQTHMYNNDYVNYLIKKIDLGEYDLELLNDQEKEILEEHLKNQKT